MYCDFLMIRFTCPSLKLSLLENERTVLVAFSAVIKGCNNNDMQRTCDFCIGWLEETSTK